MSSFSIFVCLWLKIKGLWFSLNNFCSYSINYFNNSDWKKVVGLSEEESADGSFPYIGAKSCPGLKEARCESWVMREGVRLWRIGECGA